MNIYVVQDEDGIVLSVHRSISEVCDTLEAKISEYQVTDPHITIVERDRNTFTLEGGHDMLTVTRVYMAS